MINSRSLGLTFINKVVVKNGKENFFWDGNVAVSDDDRAPGASEKENVNRKRVNVT
jgi:hypothetical protein